MKPIWIVDDDPSIRFVLEKALARENLPTRSFTHPREVLDALADVTAPPPLEDFAASLAAAFDKRLEAWRTYGLGPTLQAFLAGSIHAQGAAVTVHDTDGSVLTGTFAGLEESDGALRLRLADGRERVIRAGDIS